MFKSGSFIIPLLLIIYSAMADKQELQAVVQGNGLFTKQLYNILAKQNGNVFFSPVSAHAVLSMAFQGSKGTTYDAFTKTLGISNSSVAAEGYKDVIGSLNSVSNANIELSMANKIYIMQGYSLKKQFKDITTNKFSSSVQNINFADSETAANSINDWVEDKTKNKIKDLIKPKMLDSSTRLVLVNAIYFKGQWEKEFHPRDTRTDKFYLNNNDYIDVQMMANEREYFYKEDTALDAKVLELPYSNPDISLIIVLPNKRNGITELEKKLAETDLTRITNNMIKQEVLIKLPKFKIETTIKLNEPLKKLGLGAIFDQDADFSEMLESPEKLYVSEVIQKSFIEVNEEGTEADAVTDIRKVGSRRPNIGPLQPIMFTADHPFIIFLQTSGHSPVILFAGRIVKP